MDGFVSFMTMQFLCAYCCMELAKGKNKTLKTAIICGLLFGLFGVFYYLLVDKNDNGSDGQPPIAPTV